MVDERPDLDAIRGHLEKALAAVDALRELAPQLPSTLDPALAPGTQDGAVTGIAGGRDE